MCVQLLSNAIQATAPFCPLHSLVCSGVGGFGDQWYQSAFIPVHGIHRLKLTENDNILLQTILEVCLSEQAVYSVASITNTQKCQAFNRGTLASLPKEINFPKTFGGRLASKTSQINNTIKDIVQAKATIITGQKLSKRASHNLCACSKREERLFRCHQSSKQSREEGGPDSRTNMPMQDPTPQSVMMGIPRASWTKDISISLKRRMMTQIMHKHSVKGKTAN